AMTARLEQFSVGVAFLAVSPDGGTVAVIGADDEARVFAGASGEQTQSQRVEPLWGIAPVAVFRPDGQPLYFTGNGAGAARFPRGGGRRDADYLVGEADRATCLAVSADEAIVALGTYRGDVLVYSAGSGGRPIQQIRVGGRVRAVALSTTGRVV